MAVKFSYVDSYKYYGKCLKMENDKVELLVTVEVGPRIIYFAAKGGVNMFFNDDDQVRVSKSDMYKEIFGQDAEYHFYGGHRMWLAPQQMLVTDAPDNDPVTVEMLENGASFTCPEQKVLGYIAKLTVILDPEEPTITVTSEFTNTFDEPKKNAVWQITQCAAGGVAFFPYMRPYVPFVPGQRRAFDPSRMRKPIVPSGNFVTFNGAPGDERLIVDREYITVSFSFEKGRRAVKIGLMNQQNFAMYAYKDYLLKFGYDNDPWGTYTDLGCSQETYTDELFTEVEALSEYQTWGKGETISHTETISVIPLKAPVPDLQDREAVKAFVELHK